MSEVPGRVAAMSGNACTHCGPQRPMTAHAIQVARRIARIAPSRGSHRKPLSRRRFSIQAPQYDIVLL